MSCEFRTERLGATLVLTIFAQGKRAIASEQLFSAGIESLSVAESDANVRCVILHGSASHFWSENNFGPLEDSKRADTSLGSHLTERFDQFVDCVRTCSKPVLAAVEGQAQGLGFPIALACDLLVAADNAQFVAPAALGLFCDSVACQLPALVLPRPVALQLTWLDEPISALRLHALGLVNWLTAPGKALSYACMVAERVARLDPSSLATIKEQMNLSDRRAPTKKPHHVQAGTIPP